MLLLMSLLMLRGGVFAQVMQTTQGRDFWVGFLFNGLAAYNSASTPTFSQAGNTLSLVASSEEDCTVTATCGAWSQTVSITAGASATIVLPNTIKTYTQPRYTLGRRPSGIHVTSTANISLYALNYMSASFDVATILPTRSLGTSYVLQDFLCTPSSNPHTYDGAEFCVVGTQNGTHVTVTFAPVYLGYYNSSNVRTRAEQYLDGSTFPLTLDSGEVCQFISAYAGGTFTGSTITSDKPIAVFQGRKITNVPTKNYGAPDHLYEQSIPTDYWGQDFIVVPDARTGGNYDYIQVTSQDYDCQVYINGSLVGNTSSRRAYFSSTNVGTGRSAFRVTTSKPASVCLYMGSYNWRGAFGDPSSVIIPPVEQGTNRVTFNAYATANSTQHYANIVVPTAVVDGVMLDGVCVSSQFTPLSGTLYSYSRLPVTAGDHILSNTLGRFNAWFYGMGTMESYAYTAAMSLRNLHYELFVDGDNAHTWGDTIPVCVGTPHHFKIETDGETETRWFVDGTPQTSTDTAMDCTFTSLGIHSIIALQRGDCADPDFCDTLRLAVHVGCPAATTLTRRVYADSLPLSVNGIEYSSPGTYTQHLATTHGCDSTLTLNVVVVPHGFDDYVVTAPATPVAFYPTLNDTLPCDDAVFSIVTMPVHGNVASCYGAGNNEGHRDDLDELLGDGGGEGVDGPAPVPCLVYTPESTLGGEFGEPPTQYIGADSLRVAVCCGEECDTSWVHITVTPLPDNIVEADCTVPADSNSFEMQELFHTAYDEVASLSTPMVADVDGDGLPEIVACRYYNSTNNSYNLYFSNGIVIYNGQTGVKKYEFIVSRDYSLSGQGVVVADVDEDGKAEFFILTSDRYILCYSYSPSDDNWTLKWMSDQMDLLQIPTVVDLMGDGNKQVVCGSWIFNAQNGTLLLQGTTESDGTGFFQLVNTCHLGYSPYLCAVGDIDGDGRLEVCGGRALYKPTLTNYSGTTGNTWTLLRKAAAGSGIVNYDGETFLLDFDGDGDLDICVVGTPPISCSAASTRFDIYAWEGQNTDIVANASYTMTTRYGPTIAYCGDLDGNGAPEILFALDNTNGNALEGGMMAYTYDPAVTGNMRLMHQYTPFSETAGFTVFDFNQDGHNEIVYRGIRQLYIVDGTTLNPLCSPLTAYNPTHREYPIVADVNGDGHAEILVARSQYDYYYDYYNYSDTTRFRGSKGCIAVYGSAIPGAWSSARKVWNQYAYTPVGINEDLSVPQHPLNPATRFANGSQPYNRFLGQVPYITPQGDMFNLAPDAVALSTTAEIDGDDFNITLSLGNQGDNTLQAPYGITLYKDSYRGEVLHIETVNADLPVSDNSSTITVTLPRSMVCALADVDTLVVALNDAGTGIAQHGAQQAECDTTNNTVKVAVPHNSTGTDLQTACDSYTWIDGNTYTASNNTATVTLTNAAGCDSTVTLHLTINNPTHTATTETACDSYSWNSSQYTASGTYTYTHLDANGCTQVDTLHLTVNYSNTGTESVTTCDSYTWHGTTYTESTQSPTYTETNAAGCDSVVTLHLTVNHPEHTATTETSCENYEWNTAIYTTSGTYTYTHPDVHGCTQVDTLHLTINHSNTGIEIVTACNNYVWHGTEYTESTDTPTYNSTNAAGCDSVTTLHLTVNHCSTTTITACDSYTWNETTYTASGEYHHGTDTLLLTINYSNSGTETVTACDSYTWYEHTDITESTETLTHTLTNAAGCDSVVTLNLTINYSNTGTETVTACDSYTWHGTTHTASNSTAIYTETNIVGCDSIVTLNLTVNYSNTGTETVSACDSYTWHGTEYTASNSTATYTETNAAGCDSIVTLHLTVNHSNTGTETVTACDSYTWHETEYTSSNSTATFTETNASGCDSVVTLNLTVNHSNAATETITACDSYTWHETEYTSSNSIATYTETNAAGCDSVVTLNLTINHNNTGTETVTACNSYVWHGTEYNTSTTAPTFTTTNAAGCDSVTTLYLTINHCSTTTITACDSYTWNETTYTASGEYHHGTDTLQLTINYSNTGVDEQSACDSYTWHGTTYTASNNTATYIETNVAGCDSIVTLNLTVNHPVHIATTETACDTYTWNGMSYTTSGTYTNTHPDNNNCSQVDTLHLTINHTSAGIESVTACNSYEWNNTVYTASGTYTYSHPDNNNCTQVDTLHLTINNPMHTATIETVCDSYTWNNTLYTTSGDYTYTHPDDNNCTQVDTLHLTINRTSAGIETVTACNSYVWHGNEYTSSTSAPTYNSTNAAGCDSVTTLHLTVNHCSTTTITACDSYTWNETTYTASGEYHHGTDTLHLTINHTSSGIETVTACNSYVWHGNEYFATTDTPTHTSTNAAGCDSVITLHLTVNHCTTTTITACDSYTWNETTYTTSGEYHHGTDTLQLTINHSNTGIDEQTACDSYTWHGTTYTESTQTPTFTETNTAGCDSTVTLHLTINNPTHTATTETVCESYSWNGSQYTASGTYTYIHSDNNGCTQVDTLHLTINNPVHTATTETACESYSSNGFQYTTSGTYTYTHTDANGCTQVDTLHLTINHTSTGTETVTACNSYVWHGTEYFATTDTPTHTSTNTAGCDSVTTLHLTVNHCSTTTITACDSYTWNETTYTASGEYHHGTDTLQLTINHSNTGIDEQTACDSYTWHGTTYTASNNTVTFTETNASGCDSVVTLHLTVNHPEHTATTETACENYNWNNTVHTTSGTYTYIHPDNNNCTQVDTLHLTINNPTHTATVETACENYTWNNTSYTASGTYTYIHPDNNNCSQVDTLHLTINNPTHTATVETACENYTWNNTSYTTSGTYTYSHPDNNNCSQVDTLHLTINHTSAGIESVTACNSYVWHGNEYFATTDAPTHISTNAAGCDSVTALHLTVNHCSTTTITACDSYTWNETTYTASGEYHHGTDTLQLTINHSNTGIDEQTACDSYTWHGTTYTENTQTPTYTETNASGCDSIVTINLTVNHPEHTATTETACESYEWNNTSYTASGTYTYIHPDNNNCSQVDTLHLTINHTSAGIESVTACNSYVWHGNEYTASTSAPTFTSVNSEGCDSVTTLHLTVNHCSTTTITACDSYTWNDTTYTASGEYHHGTDTLQLTINHSNTGIDEQTACDSYTWHGTTYTENTQTPTFTETNTAGCDSVVTLYLTINNPTHTATTETACENYTWNNASYTTSGTYTYSHSDNNGCTQVDTLHLIINHTSAGIETVTACNSYVWHGTEYFATTDTPTHTSTNAAGCDSVTTLHLTVNHCSTTTITACDSYTWNETTYTTSGEYHHGTDTLILTINYGSIATLDTAVCNGFVWHGTEYTSSTSSATFITENISGCDSVTTLHLTISHCSTADTMARDSLVWGDTVYFDNDTIIEGTDTTIVTICHTVRTQIDTTVCNSFTWQGTTYFSGATIVDTMPKPDGCDSIVSLYLTVNRCGTRDTLVADSLVWGDTVYRSSDTIIVGMDTTILTICYTVRTETDTAVCDRFSWQGEVYTASTVVVDTVAKADGCDSISTLNLTLFRTPELTLTVDTVCDSAQFTIEAFTDVPWVTWSSLPQDSMVLLQQYEHRLSVRPAEPTVYTIYVSDNEEGRCGTSASVALLPFEPIVPAIRVVPDLLPQDASQFTAYDVTVGEVDWRQWYVDGVEQTDSRSPLRVYYDVQADSVVVTLVVGDDHCVYSTSLAVPIARFFLWAPNIFTPGLESNCRFTVSTVGVFETELYIYDRNGLLVFRTTDLEQGWDGSRAGRPCQQGSYVWKLYYRRNDYPDRQQVEVGTVTLVR